MTLMQQSLTRAAQELGLRVSLGHVVVLADGRTLMSPPRSPEVWKYEDMPGACGLVLVGTHGRIFFERYRPSQRTVDGDGAHGWFGV